MTDYDVVVIGPGAAGLSAGALLATEGKRVLVTDRSPVLGRAMAVFRALGVEPPLDGAGSGFHDFIPTEVGREEALRIVDSIPAEVVRHYAFCGTPEQVAGQIRKYAAAALRHL